MKARGICEHPCQGYTVHSGGCIYSQMPLTIICLHNSNPNVGDSNIFIILEVYGLPYTETNIIKTAIKEQCGSDEQQQVPLMVVCVS